MSLENNLHIYYTGKRWYIRLAPLETERFPHGIFIGTTFDSKEEAENFKKDVAEYFKCLEKD